MLPNPLVCRLQPQRVLVLTPALWRRIRVQDDGHDQESMTFQPHRGINDPTRRKGAGPDFRPVLQVATCNLGEAVEIRVRNNGTNIPPANQGEAVSAIFHYQADRQGIGFGLLISWDILTQQHGRVIAVDTS